MIESIGLCPQIELSHDIAMNTTPDDCEITLPPERKPWHVRAAMMSWILFVVGFVVNISFGKTSSLSGIVVGVLLFAIFFGGLLAAIWSTVCAFTKGPKTILVHAAIGLVLNGWVVHLAFRSYQSTQIAIGQRHAEEKLATSDHWIPTGDGWHVDRKELFAIRFPKIWNVKKQPKPKVAVVASSPLTADSPEHSELITVSVNRISPFLEPARVLASELNTLSATDGYEKRNSGTIAINDVEWFWVTYRLPISEVDSLVTSYFVIRNTRLYVVSRIALFEKPDAWTDEIGNSIESIVIPEAK